MRADAARRRPNILEAILRYRPQVPGPPHLTKKVLNDSVFARLFWRFSPCILTHPRVSIPLRHPDSAHHKRRSYEPPHGTCDRRFFNPACTCGASCTCGAVEPQFRIVPSIPIVTSVTGISSRLAPISAIWTARTIPEQQGTCMWAMVIERIAFVAKIWVSFST